MTARKTARKAARKNKASALEDWRPRRSGAQAPSPVEDGFMIYQARRKRVHFLNHTAVLVLELCNGRRSAAEIARLLEEAYGARSGLRAEVRQVLTRARAEGLLL